MRIKEEQEKAEKARIAKEAAEHAAEIEAANAAALAAKKAGYDKDAAAKRNVVTKSLFLTKLRLSIWEIFRKKDHFIQQSNALMFLRKFLSTRIISQKRRQPIKRTMKRSKFLVQPTESASLVEAEA